MNDINSAKLRASFKTYLLLKNKPVRISEFIQFLTYVDLGLGKSVSANEMSSLINKDSFTRDIIKEKTSKGHYEYSLKKR
ncbi:MAG: hypothetical protein J6Y78_11195 [Paludibacteraceae bacterium]|nr:hypothetical protein [Paludibacteraceae bacterium]